MSDEPMSPSSLQMMKDVAEIKGMLGATLSAHDERLRAVEQDIDESRSVHTVHDQALAAHAARIAVVENTANSNRDQLAKAGDQTRANAALIVSIIVGLMGVASFGLIIFERMGVFA